METTLENLISKKLIYNFLLMYRSRQHPVLGSNLLTEIETSWMNRNAEVSFLKDPVNDHSVFLPCSSLSVV